MEPPGEPPEVSPNKALTPEQVDKELFQSAEEFYAKRGKRDVQIITSSVETVRNESPAEIESRLRREEVQLKARLKMETERFRVGVLAMSAVFVVSAIVLFDKSFSDNAKAWSMSTMTGIMSAIVGYVFGKSSSSESK